MRRKALDLSRRAVRTTLLLGATTLFVGCGALDAAPGAAAISDARQHYSESITRSWNEQILVNLVRLRFLESPVFVDVSGITVSQARTRSASLSASILRPGGLDELGLGAAGAATDTPVITYTPLQGEAFARRVLSPLVLGDIEPLVRAGWSFEKLLLCCTQSFVGIENGGPDLQRYLEIAGLVGRLQRARQLRLVAEPGNVPSLHLRGGGDDLADLRRLLGLGVAQNSVSLVDGVAPVPGKLVYEGRSLLASLYALSLGIDVPAAHRAEVGPDGPPHPVKELLPVRTSSAAPADAFAGVRTPQGWFWIERSDLQAKETMALLRMLIALKSIDKPAATTVLSIPTR